MNSSKAKPLPIKIILEAFKIDPASPSYLRWTERPERHFKTKAAWKMWNARFAGKSAGYEFDDHGGRRHFRVYVNDRCYKAHRIIFAIVHGIDAECLHIDHIDGDGLNNDPNNLRLATATENQRNRGKPRNNTSGCKCVCWVERNQKWRAQITLTGRRIYLGLFNSINDASAAYEAAAREHFGEFYRPS